MIILNSLLTFRDSWWMLHWIWFGLLNGKSYIIAPLVSSEEQTALKLLSRSYLECHRKMWSMF